MKQRKKGEKKDNRKKTEGKKDERKEKENIQRKKKEIKVEEGVERRLTGLFNALIPSLCSLFGCQGNQESTQDPGWEQCSLMGSGTSGGLGCR